MRFAITLRRVLKHTKISLYLRTQKTESERCEREARGIEGVGFGASPFCVGVQFSRDCIGAFNDRIEIQWNPALRTPALYGQFRLSRQKAHIFSLKLTRFIRTPGNTDNGHFSVSRVTNSHILSTPLYGHWLSAHCLFLL